MRKWIGLIVGLLLIVIALYVAQRPFDTDRAQQADVLALATRLHGPPILQTATLAPTPLPTRTPLPPLLPTVTPIAGWARLVLQGAEMWAPNADQSVPTPMQDRQASRGIRRDVFFLVTMLVPDSGESAQVGIRIARVRVGRWPDFTIPIALDADLTGYFEQSRRPAVGRYGGLEAIYDGPSVGDDRYKRLVYWFEYGSDFWLVTFTAEGDEFNRLIPLFENSIRTFSVKSY